MTDEAKQRELERLKFLEVSRHARRRLKELGEQANWLGFPILAREFDHGGNELEKAIASQMQALKDPLKGWT